MKIKLILTAILFAVIPAMAQVRQDPDVLEYIRQYKDIAILEMKRTGVPAAVKLAQGIHETQAGKGDLVRRSNNHFGIKCKSTWTGEKVYHDDDARGECFRSYNNPADSYRDHSDFLRNNQRYSALFSLQPMDYEGWAHGLKKAGYATNPRYPAIIIKTIEDYNLNFYTEVALGMQKEPDLILVKNEAPAPVFIPAKKNETPTRIIPSEKKPKKQWPSGVFSINETKVMFAPAGTALLAVAQENRLGLARLLEFNDMEGNDVLENDQLVFLQRKRRTGAAEIHVVSDGENLHDIAQQQGIRLENLLELNGIDKNARPAPGEKLYLKKKNPGTVAMASNTKPAVETPSFIKNPLLHTVQQKETLYSIARKYAVTIHEIKEWNRLNGEALHIGQQLMIQNPTYAQDSGTR